MPKDAKEAYDLLYTAYEINGPVAIRYPRGDVFNVVPNYESWQSVPVGSWTTLKSGADAYLLSMGPILDDLVQLSLEDLSEAEGN